MTQLLRAAALAALLASGGTAVAETNLDSLASACLETPLSGCRVVAAGILEASDGAPPIAWQTQRGFTPEEGVMGGFVLFAWEPEGWTLLEGRVGGWYEPPVRNEMGQIHVAGYSGGTGAYNLDRLYEWGDLGHVVYREGWREIEMHGWLKTIGERLPAGLEIWKGVRYDFRHPGWGLSARTALWRPTDANCCPTGGEAVITLEVQGDRLVATAVQLLQ